MRDDPGLETGAIAACLETGYGIRAASIQFLPLGYDLNAAVYEIVADDGASWFLKVRSGPINEAGLRVSRALLELGIDTILAPVPTRSAHLWRPLDERGQNAAVLYPFIQGENAMFVGLSDHQWRAFGATLRAVHDSGMAEHFAGTLRSESFSLGSATVVRDLLARIDQLEPNGDAAARFATFWRANAGRIHGILDRAEELGRSLQAKPFERVLCHGDIHAANILVSDEGRIWLVDWDDPLIAPRDRDLLFVIGSRIARPVAPREECLFFEGYGPISINPDALIYYRYERIVEDLGEIGRSVFLDPTGSEAAKQKGAKLAMSFLAPDGDIDRAETVSRTRWPDGSG